MRRLFFNISAVLVTAVMLVSFVIPVGMATPYAALADPGIMRWDTVGTPGSYDSEHVTKAGRLDILNKHTPAGSDTPHGSEIISMFASKNSNAITTIIRDWTGANYFRTTATSSNWGLNWTINSEDVNYNESNAYKVYQSEAHAADRLVTTGVNGPRSLSAGFDGTGLDTNGTENETIRFADISQPYGTDNRRDWAIATVGGHNGGRLLIRSTNTWGSWNAQLNPNNAPPNPLGTNTSSGIDYLAVKFSPNYASDSSIAVVYADNTSTGGGATYYNVAYRDVFANTSQWAFPAPGIEVKNPASPAGASPNWDEINTVDLSLPSDFSGQSASLRRAYISIDAYNGGKAKTCQDGIYRIDDITPYMLMDTSSNADKSIYSIAYYGTYASGKLLAGERMGYPCSATVPTWFTDSPTTCPIPCWYPALKPATGAANQFTCANGSKTGVGAAIVDWNLDGSMAIATTSSLADTVYAGQSGNIGGVAVNGGTGSSADRRLWYQMYNWDAVPNDESALSISRNNGETWNQLSMIDTTIDWFNDVAVSPDCTTIYLASVNRNVGANCNEFDSVWRSSMNPNVTSPLPAIPPVGTYWERVYTRTTSGSCNVTQTDLPILRVVPSCTDKKNGEIVGWAAQGATATTSGKTGVMAWSPDYGDYWANIGPRFAVQDFAFESSTTLYVLGANGLVQRLPYSGTYWSTNLPSYDTVLSAAHTIVAVPDGKVLVGAAVGSNSDMMAAYSADKGVTFEFVGGAVNSHGNMHVIFDVDFKNNNFIYAGDDGQPTSAWGGTGISTVYRNTATNAARWTDNDMMSPGNGSGSIFAGGLDWVTVSNDPPHAVGQFGLVQAWTGAPEPALYTAHNILNSGNSFSTTIFNSAVCRTLKPRDGMPKPGILWDCLDIFSPLSTSGIFFTLEPTSLKACGCCSLDTNTTLYAIDDESGEWFFGATNPGFRSGRRNNHLNTAAVSTWDTAYPGYTPTLRQGMLWA